jgi:hypothetical protein
MLSLPFPIRCCCCCCLLFVVAVLLFQIALIAK